MNQTGIYKITNLINNKIYIGQTTNFVKRKREHINNLIIGNHVNKHLQSAWNKYGKYCFTFELVELCERDSLTEREQYWIDYYGGIDSINVYNVRDAGDSGTFSKETRALISTKLKGRHHTEATKLKIKHTSLGRHHTEEAKRKIGEASKGKKYMLGRHLSEETKKKISEKLKGRPAPNKGSHVSEETRKKIGEASRNRIRRRWTEEEKLAQSKRLKGNPAPNKGKLTGTSKKVLQYSLDGELLNIYESTHELYLKCGFNPGCISKCCRGLMRTAYGYKWKYLE